MTPVGRRTVKGVTPLLYEEQLNNIGTVGEEKKGRGDTFLTETG